MASASRSSTAPESEGNPRSAQRRSKAREIAPTRGPAATPRATMSFPATGDFGSGSRVRNRLAAANPASSGGARKSACASRSASAAARRPKAKSSRRRASEAGPIGPCRRTSPKPPRRGGRTRRWKGGAGPPGVRRPPERSRQRGETQERVGLAVAGHLDGEGAIEPRGIGETAGSRSRFPARPSRAPLRRRAAPQGASGSPRAPARATAGRDERDGDRSHSGRRGRTRRLRNGPKTGRSGGCEGSPPGSASRRRR